MWNFISYYLDRFIFYCLSHSFFVEISFLFLNMTSKRFFAHDRSEIAAYVETQRRLKLITTNQNSNETDQFERFEVETKLNIHRIHFFTWNLCSCFKICLFWQNYSWSQNDFCSQNRYCLQNRFCFQNRYCSQNYFWWKTY